MTNDELCELLGESDFDAPVVIRIGGIDNDVEVEFDQDAIRLIPIDRVTGNKAQLADQPPEAW